MKCLTICQPYAELIMLSKSDQRHKRVENRTWPTRYRGPLAIHAGKSRQWIEMDDERFGGFDVWGFRVSNLTFGAIVGVVDVINCVERSTIVNFSRTGMGFPTSQRWLVTHRHAEGPLCWVLANVRRLPEPVPYKGAQGLFEVPDEVLAAAVPVDPQEATA